MTHKPPMFTQGHYNILAKEIREELDKVMVEYGDDDKKRRLVAAETLVHLALKLAKRFKKDNERFDPVHFLDTCSPNVDLYPLSELWEDVTES